MNKIVSTADKSETDVKSVNDVIADFKKSLHDAEAQASIAMEGFERIRALLEAIKHLAAASDQEHIVSIAREAVRISDEFHNIADCAREAFEIAAAGVNHG